MFHQIAVSDEKGLVVCDTCKEKDTPDKFAYIGPINRNNKNCNPFKGVEGNWEQTCFKCETENYKKLRNNKYNGQRTNNQQHEAST